MISPKGYLTSAAAIEAVGRSTFGESWTGAERAARTTLVSAEEYDLACVTPGSMMSGGGAGGHIFKPDPDPARRWPYGDPHSPEYQGELQASVRWREAVAQLLEQLAGADRAAISLDRSSGKRYPLKSDFWLRADAAQTLQSGIVSGNGPYRPKGELFVAATAPRLVPSPAPTSIDWRPDKTVALKAWCAQPAAQAEARRRARLFLPAPVQRDTCRALATMWEEAGRGPAKWQTIEQYLIGAN